MKNLFEIKKELTAARETRQVTNAMYLLSSAQVKKSMGSVEHNRHYTTSIHRVMGEILHSAGSFSHPFLTPEPVGKTAFLVIASDKGMCGSFNHDVVDAALAQVQTHPEPFITTVGSVATDLFRAAGIEPSLQWIGPSVDPSLYYSRQIAEHFLEMYRLHQIDEWVMIYTAYHSRSSWQVETTRLLPLKESDFTDVVALDAAVHEPLYQPDEQSVFDTAVPQYLIGLVYEALQQSAACESMARMTAMQSATDNADEMIRKLTLGYNAARQLAITSEINEIANAAELAAENEAALQQSREDSPEKESD